MILLHTVSSPAVAGIRSGTPSDPDSEQSATPLGTSQVSAFALRFFRAPDVRCQLPASGRSFPAVSRRMQARPCHGAQGEGAPSDSRSSVCRLCREMKNE